MATTTRNRGGRSSGGRNTRKWEPRRVRSEEDRGGGRSEFLRLDEGQRFLGYALFDGDPAVDEPGYYEYLEHWDNAARRSIPCAGDDCPLCEEGDKPKVRAQTTWLVTKDENGNDIPDGELRIFQANWNVIKMLTEMRAEGDKIKGTQFRVTRTDDRGNYMMLPKQERLKDTEVKALLKSDDAPNYEEMITVRLNKAMEGYSVRRALDDEDDEAEAKNSRSSRRTAPPADDPDEPAEGDFPEGDEVDVYVFEVDDEKIVVGREGVEEQVEVWAVDGSPEIGDVEPESWVVISVEARDDDGDYFALITLANAEEPAPEEDPEPEPAADELPSEITGEVFEVTGKVDEDNGAIPLKSDDFEFVLYVLEGVDVDWADYEVGTKVKINAEKDNVGDMITSDPPEVQVATKRRGTTSRGTGAQKKTSAGRSTSKTTTKTKTATRKTGRR